MERRERRNAAVNTLGEFLWGLNASLISSATVLVVVLRSFGAGRTMIGSITTIETVTMLLPQIVGIYLFRSRSQLKTRLLTYHYVVVIPWIALMGVPLLPHLHLSALASRTLVLTTYAFYLGSIGVIAAVWMDWLARIFGEHIRGTAMGIAFCGSAAGGTVGALAAGWWISLGGGPSAYAALFIAAAVIAALSITAFWLVDDPGAGEADNDAPTLSAILGHFRESLADSNFRAFLIGRMLATAGFCILPLVADYFSSPDGGSIQPGTLVACGSAMTIGNAIANIGLGRLGDIAGHRIGILIGVGMQATTLVILLFVPGEIGCIAAYFTAGLCSGSAIVSHFNMVFETCPHENRMAHITIANLIIGCGTVFMPLIAGYAAGHFGTRPVFAASLFLSLVALGWFLFRVQEPRKRKLAESPSLS
jgi:MFS family permease